MTHKPMGDGMTILAGIILPFAAIFAFGFVFRFVVDHPWWALAIVIAVPIAFVAGIMIRELWRESNRLMPRPRLLRPIKRRAITSWPRTAEGGGVIRYIEPEPAKPAPAAPQGQDDAESSK